jgi:outer membrane protein, heavy metal efflux system
VAFLSYGDAAMKRSTPALVAALVGALPLLLLTPRVARAEFPTLDVAIQKARTHALVVAEAEGELGVANAQMKNAQMSSLGNPYSEIQFDRPFTDGAGGLPAGHQVQAMTYNYFPLDIAGQRGKRIDEADKLIGWRKVGLIHATAQATGEVVSAYGEYVISTARIEAANAGEVTAREEAKYFQGKFEAKDTTLYEKSIAEAEVARWVQQKAEAELRVANVRARFAQLVGEVDPDRPGGNTSLLVPALKNSWDDAFIAHMVDKTPAVSRLLAEKTYWESSIERYEREKVPPVSFEIIAGRGGQGELRLGGGAVITFPITRRYQGEIARAEHGREHALRHVDLYRTLVTTRLRAARDAIGSVNKALEELDKNGIPALERAVMASVEGFRAGKIDLTRAMLARRDLAIARARRLDLLEASWHAYSDLVVFSGELP